MQKIMVRFNIKGAQVYANKNMLMQHLLYELQHITLKQDTRYLRSLV